MLRNSETTEAVPGEALTTARETAEAIGVDNETLRQDRDAALAELTACIEANISRNRRRSKTVRRTVSLMALTAPACVFALTRGVEASTMWFLEACLEARTKTAFQTTVGALCDFR